MLSADVNGVGIELNEILKKLADLNGVEQARLLAVE